MSITSESQTNTLKITNYSSPFQSLHNKKPHTYSICFPSVSPYTKQSFKDECDINTLMARYQSTGEIPVINQLAPQYLDVTQGFDFVEMQHQVLEAQYLFNQLPSTLRSRFANNPAEFIAYCQDEANLPEMKKLGLLKDISMSALPGTPGSPNVSPSGNPTSDSASGTESK